MKYKVNCPVIDLRSKPSEITAKDFSHQDERDTQLLFGELLQVEEWQGQWAKVKALEQAKFCEKNIWQPYPGWVKSNEIKEANPDYLNANFSVYSLYADAYDQPNGSSLFQLSMGTHFFAQAIDQDWVHIIEWGFFCKRNSLKLITPSTTVSRANIVDSAKRLLGQPYLWGGRAAYYAHHGLIGSVDCSGLVNLAFRACGLCIPRDAHDQFLFFEKISKNEIQPGDLLFFEHPEKKRISHVVMYLGNKHYIEAPQTGSFVRVVQEESLLKERDRSLQHYRSISHSISFD